MFERLIVDDIVHWTKTYKVFLFQRALWLPGGQLQEQKLFVQLSQELLKLCVMDFRDITVPKKV